MSLINQMLKDLANRSQPRTNPEALLPELMERIKLKTHKHKMDWLIYGVIIFLMITISILAMQKLFRKHSEKVVTQSIVALENSQAKYPQNPPADFTVLTGITLDANENATNLRLLLDKEATYRVTSLSENELSITLDNTNLVTSLPTMNTMDSGIKVIRMTTVNHDLIIHLSLMEGTRLAHIDLRRVKELPELQVEFSHKTAAAPSVALAEPKEKTPLPIQKKNSIKSSFAYSKEDEFEEARTLSLQGRNNEAVVTLTNILASDPEFFPARNLLANILYDQGNFEQASSVLKIGLQQRPLFPPYVELEAQIMVTKGKINDAINLLQTAPPTLREYPEYHALLAALYQRVGKSTYAAGVYEELLKLQPDNSIWWLGLAIARESMNKRIEALDAFAKANTDNLTPELRTYIESRISNLQG